MIDLWRAICPSRKWRLDRQAFWFLGREFSSFSSSGLSPVVGPAPDWGGLLPSILPPNLPWLSLFLFPYFSFLKFIGSFCILKRLHTHYTEFETKTSKKVEIKKKNHPWDPEKNAFWYIPTFSFFIVLSFVCLFYMLKSYCRCNFASSLFLDIIIV